MVLQPLQAQRGCMHFSQLVWKKLGKEIIAVPQFHPDGMYHNWKSYELYTYNWSNITSGARLTKQHATDGLQNKTIEYVESKLLLGPIAYPLLCQTLPPLLGHLCACLFWKQHRHWGLQLTLCCASFGWAYLLHTFFKTCFFQQPY